MTENDWLWSFFSYLSFDLTQTPFNAQRKQINYLPIYVPASYPFVCIQDIQLLYCMYKLRTKDNLTQLNWLEENNLFITSVTVIYSLLLSPWVCICLDVLWLLIKHNSYLYSDTIFRWNCMFGSIFNLFPYVSH